MKKHRDARNNAAQGRAVQVGDSGIGLAVGLSLGAFAGIVIDSIGLGMMLGIAAGLSAAAVVGALRGNRQAEDRKENGRRRE